VNATDLDPDLDARPLTPESYAPYGDVLMASPRGEPGKPANMGTARRYNRLAALENLRPGGATPNACVFRCAPRVDWPMEVTLLEKHPASTQLFVPMNARRYVVIVALGGDAPDLATLAAFVASGAQAVTYRPGVWHHPMVALEGETDFACLVWEDDSEGDCAVVPYPEGKRPRVRLPR
jgi:ureidoglycolate lyase